MCQERSRSQQAYTRDLTFLKTQRNQQFTIQKRKEKEKKGKREEKRTEQTIQKKTIKTSKANIYTNI